MEKADISDNWNQVDNEIEHLSLNGRVLILNQSYEPLSICSVKKAILLLYLTKAEIISKKESTRIRSVNYSIPFPSIIRLLTFIRIPFKQVVLSRKNIHYRDNFTCQYCGTKTKNLTIDHIIPKSRGGDDSWENLVSSCKKCNNKKGSQTPEEANMKLLSKPRRPNQIIFIQQFINKNNEDWKPYLFLR